MTDAAPTEPGPVIGRVWTLWLPILVALVPAAFFVLIGGEVRQPNGIPYACPSAARQLLGDDSGIRPRARAGEVRLYDPTDPGLVDPPGVARRCRRKNLEGGSIAFLVLTVGLAVGVVRSGRAARAQPASSAPAAAR